MSHCHAKEIACICIAIMHACALIIGEKKKKKNFLKIKIVSQLMKSDYAPDSMEEISDW